MEKDVIFHILGIPQTKEEAEIRNAYRCMLRENNPEDNPEGFKRLRQAYEEALAYARKKEDTKAVLNGSKDEIDVWMEKIQKLYEDIHSRYDIEKWKTLFEDEVCYGLDTSLEARKKLLLFLMDHIHLPHEVWKEVNKNFDLVADYEQLKQQFPEKFLEFAVYYVDNETFLPFELLDYRDLEEDGTGADAYIDAYFEIKRKNDMTDCEGVEQDLEDLQAFGVYHPYEKIERLRFYNNSKRKQEACRLAEQLLKEEWYVEGRDLTYAQLYIGEAFWNVGHRQEAYQLWTRILEVEPRYYMAKFYSARYLLEEKRYHEAKEMLLELMDLDDRNEKAVDMIRQVNEALIEELRTKWENNETDPHLPGNMLALEMGWNLFQNDRMQEAKELLEPLQVEEEEKYDYCNLFGCLLYQMGEYEPALPYLEEWLARNKKLQPDGTKKMEKRISRRGRACHTLGGCYYKLGRLEEAEALIREAIGNYERKGDRLNCMQYLANFLLETKQYERAVEASEEILREDDGYYPAYLSRQEAYFRLERGQEVVDDYYHAIDIYPGFYKPYLFAAEIFLQYGQFEDAQSILERAKEKKAEFSPRLRLCEVKIQRKLAQTYEERREALQQLQILDELLQKHLEHPEQVYREQWEKWDIEDVSEIMYERALLCWDNNELEEALRYMGQAIQQNRGKLQYRLVRGHIYREKGEYRYALEDYDAALEEEQSAEIHYAMGLCYDALQESEKAAQCFIKTVELDPNYRDVNDKLAAYYIACYRKKYRRQDHEEAIYYATHHIRLYPETDAWLQRGTFYLEAYAFEEAEADFKKALEQEPDSAKAWYGLGCCAQRRGEAAQAIAYFKKAAKGMEQEPSSRLFQQMALAYRALGEYDKAIACYEKNLRYFPKETEIWGKIGNLYLCKKDYDRAKQSYKKQTSIRRYSNLGCCYLLQGKTMFGLQYYRKRIRESNDKEKAASYAAMASAYFRYFGNYQKAFLFYRRALSVAWSAAKRSEYALECAKCCRLMDKKEKARKYAILAEMLFRESGQGKRQDYIEFPEQESSRRGKSGWYFLCIGKEKEAREEFEKMGLSGRCRSCAHPVCYAGKMYLGYFYQVTGEKEKALAILRDLMIQQGNPYKIEAKNVVEKIV